MTKQLYNWNLAIWVLLLIGCTSKSLKTDFLLNERDIIPEGVALDKRTGTIYIGSTYKRKIIQIDKDGRQSDFIPQKMEGVWGFVGMEVDEKRGLLWANTAHANEVMPLIDPDSISDWMTNVSVFDIETRELKKQYRLHAPKGFLNDLTVLPNGDVFITESVDHKVYKIAASKDSLELFLDLPDYNFLNGIIYDAALNCLYVAASEGILKIDTATKKAFLVHADSSIDSKDIDGLAIYDNSLIGHQSTKVVRFYLNADGTAITKSEVLDAGPEFDSSTTGELDGKGNYYFIVNSQVQSGIDRAKRTIKPIDSLENTIIRRIKL